MFHALTVSDTKIVARADTPAKVKLASAEPAENEADRDEPAADQRADKDEPAAEEQPAEEAAPESADEPAPKS